MTVTSFIGPLLTSLDRFVIASIAGAKAVTYYTVPFNLASRVTALPGSLSNALFPRFSAASEVASRRLMYEAVRTLSVILTPLIIAGMLIMGSFLTWWVGLEAVPTIVALREKIEQLSVEESQRLLARLSHLPERDRQLIAQFGPQLVHKILHLPTAQIRNVGDAERCAQLASSLRFLFRLDDVTHTGPRAAREPAGGDAAGGGANEGGAAGGGAAGGGAAGGSARAGDPPPAE